MPMRKLKDVVANRPIVAAAARHSAVELASLMARHNIGSVLIMNGTHLEGIVTERDIITRVVAQGRDPAQVMAEDIMTRSPTVMAADRPFSRALVTMAEGGFRHMPVVEGFDVVGLVSMRDAIGVEHEEMDRLIRAFDAIAAKT